MQESVPVGRGAMAAILGMTPDQVEALCREASQGEVLSPANLNTPSQMSLRERRLQWAGLWNWQRAAVRERPYCSRSVLHFIVRSCSQPKAAARIWANSVSQS